MAGNEDTRPLIPSICRLAAVKNATTQGRFVRVSSTEDVIHSGTLNDTKFAQLLETHLLR